MTGWTLFLAALTFVLWKLWPTAPTPLAPRIATRAVTCWCEDCREVRELTVSGACGACDSRAVEVRGNREHERLQARDAARSHQAAVVRLRDAVRGRRAS